MVDLLDRAGSADPAVAPIDLGGQRVWPRLRADLRLASRQSLRGWSASLLVIGLVSLPMALVTGAIVFGTSHLPTDAETITAELGEAEAWVAVAHGPDPSLRQYLDEPTWWEIDRDPETGAALHEELPPLASPASLLPTGSEVLEIGEGAVTAETAGGVGTVAAVVGDAGATVLDGRFTLHSGTAADASDEAMVSPGALERLAVEVGDTLTLTDPAATYTITGVLSRAEDPDAREVVFLPGTPENRALQADPTSTRWYVPEWMVTADDVVALNQQGIIVFDRTLYQDPGAMASPAFGADGAVWSIVSVAGAAAVFAGYLIVLLAGAAFSVSARRQQRSLAVAASVGATRASVFRIVLLQGTVLGLVGGALGAVVGIGLGILFLHLLDDGAAASFWGVHIPSWAIAAVVLFGVVVGTAAAIAPARAATKGDVIAALRGSRTPVRVRTDRPLWGSLLLLVGVVLTVTSGLWLAAISAEPVQAAIDTRRTLCIIGIIAGPILLQLGVILAGHWIISLLSRALSRIGIAPRLASRDAAANPGRIVPAFAAIAACAFLASVSLGSLALTTKQTERGWYYASPVGTVSIVGSFDSLPGGAPVTGSQSREVEQEARDILAIGDPTAVATLWKPGDPRVYDESWNATNLDDTVISPQLQSYVECEPGQDFGSCWTTGVATLQGHEQVAVVEPGALATVLGRQLNASELARYRDGGALTTNPDYVTANGTIVFQEVTIADLDSDWNRVTPDPVSTTALPAVVVDLDQNRSSSIFVSPGTAAELGIVAVGWQVVAVYETPVSTSTVDGIQQRAELASSDTVFLWAQLETGPPDAAPWLWLVVGATAVLVIGASSVALGLARIERRPDDATLAAVGGTRALRRTIALWQAAIVAGVGMITGVVAGILPVWGVAIAFRAMSNPPLLTDLPWPALAALAIGLPLAIALVSWLVPPREPDLTRRTAIA